MTRIPRSRRRWRCDAPGRRPAWFEAFRASFLPYHAPVSARDLVLQSLERLPVDAGWDDVLDEVIELAASQQGVAEDEAGIAAVLAERTAQFEAAGTAGCVPHAQVMRRAVS